MIFSDACYLQSKCAKYKRGECVPSSFCIKLFKTDELFNKGLFTEMQKHYLPMRVDDDGTDANEFRQLKNIETNIEDFVKNGKNLYLFSPNTGNGKTSWALRLAQAYIDKIWYKSDISCKVLFISVPKFFIMLKESIREENEYIKHIKECVMTCDLVIWDDIGSKPGTEFEMDNLFNIIDYRVSSAKTNIYTSNMNYAQLRERVGERLYSRVINLSDKIQLCGMDKRGAGEQ